MYTLYILRIESFVFIAVVRAIIVTLALRLFVESNKYC